MRVPQIKLTHYVSLQGSPHPRIVRVIAIVSQNVIAIDRNPDFLATGHDPIVLRQNVRFIKFISVVYDFAVTDFNRLAGQADDAFDAIDLTG